MNEYIGTFKFQDVKRDDFVPITAPSEMDAMILMEQNYKGSWSCVYELKKFRKEYFRGKALIKLVWKQ